LLHPRHPRDPLRRRAPARLHEPLLLALRALSPAQEDRALHLPDLALRVRHGRPRIRAPPRLRIGPPSFARGWVTWAASKEAYPWPRESRRARTTTSRSSPPRRSR